MQNENIPKDIKKINEVTWEIPTSYKEGMNVPARIIATEKLLNQMDKGVFDQVTNVACLPGIVRHAYCMPDGHWGYGFPIGGVAAFDPEEISGFPESFDIEENENVLLLGTVKDSVIEKENYINAPTQLKSMLEQWGYINQ